MDLCRLRTYAASERTKTGLLPVVVLDDGLERIVLRSDGDPAWLKIGADRLLTAALDLVAAVAALELPAPGTVR
jgi:hypothetical protein